MQTPMTLCVILYFHPKNKAGRLWAAALMFLNRLRLFHLHPIHCRAAAVLPNHGLPAPAQLQLALLPLQRPQERLWVEEGLDLLNL